MEGGESQERLRPPGVYGGGLARPRHPLGGPLRTGGGVNLRGDGEV